MSSDISITRDHLWTVKDVARFLKLSESWVYHQAEAGLLPCVRLGRSLRFDRSAIAAYSRGEWKKEPGSLHLRLPR